VSCDNPLDNPLVKAAEKGLTEAIKCLLEAGANPNVHDTVRMLLLSHSCVLLGFSFSTLVL
jgi:ankyrin repeat protein